MNKSEPATDTRRFPVIAWVVFCTVLFLSVGVAFWVLGRAPAEQSAGDEPSGTKPGLLTSLFRSSEQNAFLRRTQPLALHRVFALPETHVAWAVGDDGLILKTLDGGETWVLQATGTTNRLNSICFADPHRGVAVGDHLTLLTTTNGGFSWRPVSTDDISWHTPAGSEGPKSYKSMKEQASRSGNNLDESGPIQKSPVQAAPNDARPRPGRDRLVNLNDVTFGPGNNWFTVGDAGTFLSAALDHTLWRESTASFTDPKANPANVPDLASIAFLRESALILTRRKNLAYWMGRPNARWSPVTMETNAPSAENERRVVAEPSGAFWVTGRQPIRSGPSHWSWQSVQTLAELAGNQVQSGFDLCFLTRSDSVPSDSSGW
jgi:hypothetical protein